MKACKGIVGRGNIDERVGRSENVASHLLKGMGNSVEFTSNVVNDTHPFLRVLTGMLKKDLVYWQSPGTNYRKRITGTAKEAANKCIQAY